MKFPKTDKTQGPVEVHWMDGGIQPERPEELGPNETFGDGGNGTYFIGTKGNMMCGTYGANPQLLPTSRTNEVKVPQNIHAYPAAPKAIMHNGLKAALPDMVMLKWIRILMSQDR